MSEFKIVQEAAFSPTSCTLCGDHVGPFIDTHLTLPIHGHVYICAGNANSSGCLAQMATLIGWHGPEIMDDLAAQSEQIAELRAELIEERKNKTLTPAGIRQLVEEVRS